MLLRGKYFFLSNYSKYKDVKIVYNDYEYDTVEEAYQVAKSDNPEYIAKIRKYKRADVAKRIGKTAPLKPDWYDINLEIMENLVRQKFSYPKLAQRLAATGTEYLCEDNTWHDNFWGNCTCDACKNIPGENHLGKILMKIRAEKQAIIYK